MVAWGPGSWQANTHRNLLLSVPRHASSAEPARCDDDYRHPGPWQIDSCHCGSYWPGPPEWQARSHSRGGAKACQLLGQIAVNALGGAPVAGRLWCQWKRWLTGPGAESGSFASGPAMAASRLPLRERRRRLAGVNAALAAYSGPCWPAGALARRLPLEQRLLAARRGTAPAG